MTTNLYARLRNLLPPPGVLVGRVIAHNAEDDTSTVELPLGIGLSSYAEGVAAGSLIRPRGRTVPIGSNAFVRAGVVESQAPDGDPVEIVIGKIIEGGCCGGAAAAEPAVASALLIQMRNGYDGDQGSLDLGVTTPAPVADFFAPYAVLYAIPGLTTLAAGTVVEAVNGSDAPASAIAYLPLEADETYEITAQDDGAYEDPCSITITTANGRVYACALTGRVEGVPSTLTVERTA